MLFEFDPKTGQVNFNGHKIGKHIFKNGKSTVQITLEYETGGEWIVPLTWLAHGLSLIQGIPSNEPVLTMESPEDSIEDEFDAPRYLTEKQVKRGGYVWLFHKSDKDNWPSMLHGHDYEKGLVLDAISGQIFDSVTRAHCKTLKRKHLAPIQEKLRSSNDFAKIVGELIDGET